MNPSTQLRARLGVLGGTFDPPHVGHLALAEQAREQLRLDRVLFIPAGDPWRKSQRAVTPAVHRLAMIRLAVAGNPAFAVDDSEVRRKGPTYSVDTLRELRARLATADELYFVIGQDALADLPHWRDPAGIAALALIAVARRPFAVLRAGSEPVEGPRADAEPPALPFDASRLVRVEMPLIDVSSTDLRARARAGRSLRYLVPDAVAAYIREKGLYAG